MILETKPETQKSTLILLLARANFSLTLLLISLQKRIYETAKNSKENGDRLTRARGSDSLHSAAVGKCSGSTVGSGSPGSPEHHETTGSDFSYAAYVQADVYNAVDSIEGEYQPYKSDIGPRPGASLDAATATAAHNVLVNYFSSEQHWILTTRHFKSRYQTGLQNALNRSWL